ncbi:hypothetical protein NDU88_001635 [Pleurodeles waltl]|uniref:Uncharacterized protein n=1 Tax=Pleurodeles waltl TaxID=8319 RepID=A0AAV7TIU1_PLEWA|nr:hypothetical protein NDU88_001635 [Pleurodeles waltl]
MRSRLKERRESLGGPGLGPGGGSLWPGGRGRRHQVSGPALCTVLRDPPSILPDPRDESGVAGRGREDRSRCLFPLRPPPVIQQGMVLHVLDLRILALHVVVVCVVVTREAAFHVKALHMVALHR